MRDKTTRAALILALLLIYCFAFQGLRGLYEPDEGRYSAVALQMLKSHDWMTPRTHPDQEHWAKPPLTYWAMAASISLFGQTEFAVRFPNALSFFGIIAASYLLGTVFIPRRPWLVALISGTFLFPATMCNGATTDFPLTMWETLGVYCFAYLYWSGKVERQKLHERLMWIFFSLAFLTKGPPGLLPLLCIIIFCLLKGPKMRHVPVKWIRGFVILLTLGGSWYWYSMAHNPALGKYFVWNEIILRVFSGHHERHAQWLSFLYIYVPVLVFGSLPWSYWTGRGLKRSFDLTKEELFINKTKHSYQNTFLILWLTIPFAVFVVSRSNLPLYVLPLFVPMAIITAKEFERNDLSLRKYRNHIAAWCLLIVLVRPVMSFVPRGKDSSRFAANIRAKYPQPVEEMVFVNTRPALGLMFYTGSDVRYIPMQFNDIQNELHRNRTRLWFVPEEEVEEFRTNVKSNTDILNELGTIKAWNNYMVFSENSGTI